VRAPSAFRRPCPPTSRRSPPNSASARSRWLPPSPCSTKAPPCPSSRATARKPPAGSTTPSCAISKSASATCASWKTAARRSSPASTEQGKLTPELRAEIDAADTKQRLEDLYLPYKQKRRTKAQIAREAGLEPLADALLADPTLTPEAEAAKFINAEEKRHRRRQGRARRRAPDPDGALRRRRRTARRAARILGHTACSRSTVVEGKETEGAKFRDYFDFREPIASMPSHRALALLRGRNEGMLRLALDLDSELRDPPASLACRTPCEPHRRGISRPGPPGRQMAADGALDLEGEALAAPRTGADERSCASAPRKKRSASSPQPARPAARRAGRPARDDGPRPRHPHRRARSPWSMPPASCSTPPPSTRTNRATTGTARSPRSRRWREKHKRQLVAIGNGTASRETDKLAAGADQAPPGTEAAKIVVSEAGASVYSASELAAKEFPDLDVSLRGAVSIARRLQDPLAELVKIEPKSIGVGQYQHDVNQTQAGARSTPWSRTA
jgi:uncharacterized protein